MTAETTTRRYFANIGVSTEGGEPALYLYSPDPTVDNTLEISMADWDDRTLTALEATIRDAGFDLLGEWEIDTDGDLIREVRPTSTEV